MRDPQTVRQGVAFFWATRILLGALWFGICLALFQFSESLLIVSGAKILNKGDTLTIPYMLCGFFAAIVLPVMFPVWVYVLHREISRRLSGYPVKPIKALLRVLIPVYAILGTLRIFLTLARFISANSTFHRQARTIAICCLWLIGMWVIYLTLAEFGLAYFGFSDIAGGEVIIFSVAGFLFVALRWLVASDIGFLSGSVVLCTLLPLLFIVKNVDLVMFDLALGVKEHHDAIELRITTMTERKLRDDITWLGGQLRQDESTRTQLLPHTKGSSGWPIQVRFDGFSIALSSLLMIQLVLAITILSLFILVLTGASHVNYFDQVQSGFGRWATWFWLRCAQLTIIAFPLWLYMLCTEIQTSNAGRTMKPWLGVLQSVIPVYSVLGMWKIFRQDSDKVASEGVASRTSARSLIANGRLLYLPWAIWIALMFLKRGLIESIAASSFVIFLAESFVSSAFPDSYIEGVIIGLLNLFTIALLLRVVYIARVAIKEVSGNVI